MRPEVLYYVPECGKWKDGMEPLQRQGIQRVPQGRRRFVIDDFDNTNSGYSPRTFYYHLLRFQKLGTHRRPQNCLLDNPQPNRRQVRDVG